MIKKLKLDAYDGAIRTGGFFGWFLTVMFLCGSNIADDALFESASLTFMLSAVIAMLVITVVMLFLDFEGLLADKWLRWLPGLLMAESGIALSLSGTRTITLYSAIAGVAAALGAIGMVTSLLKVKVSQRIFSVGAGLAVGAVIRTTASLIVEYMSRSTGRIVASVLIGIIAAVTVHTTAYSKEAKPLLARAEAKPAEILKKIPAVYIWVLLLGSAFFFAQGTVEANLSVIVTPKLTFAFKYYDVIAYISFALTAFIAVFIVKPHALASLFAFGSALASAAAILLGLRSPTSWEAAAVTVLCFAAFACFKMCMYLIVVTFSLDRPHPIFYALFGFGVMMTSQLLGTYLRVRVLPENSRTVTIVLLILIPVGAFMISRAMRYSGFSQEQLEKRHRIRKLISSVSEEKELSERERAMLNLAVLDGYSAEMMPDKLGISRNTVKASVKALTAKFGVSSLDELTQQFDEMIAHNEEELRRRAELEAQEKSVLIALAAQNEQAVEAAKAAAEEEEQLAAPVEEKKEESSAAPAAEPEKPAESEKPSEPAKAPEQPKSRTQEIPAVQDEPKAEHTSVKVIRRTREEQPAEPEKVPVVRAKPRDRERPSSHRQAETPRNDRLANMLDDMEED